MSASALDDYAELRLGRVHFRLEGPAERGLIVMIHGATVPHWVFDRLVDPIWAMGYSTLRFDLYGHGLSSGVSTTYTIDLFAQQTLDLIDRLSVRRPVVLLGHSLGAAIAAAVAAARPEIATRMVLLAPFLGVSTDIPLRHVLRVRGVGELAMRMIGLPRLRRRRTERYLQIGRPELGERFREQSHYSTLGRALLSMIREGAFGDQTPRYKQLGKLMNDTLVVWGTRDAVIERGDIDSIRCLLPGHRYAEIEGAEHNFLLTHATEIAYSMADQALRIDDDT